MASGPPSIAVIGLPDLPRALAAAGYSVLANGATDARTVAPAVREASSAGKVYVAIVAGADPALRAWISVQIAGGRPVLVLTSDALPFGAPLPGTRTVELPATVDEVMAAFGAPAKGTPYGTVRLAVDGSVSAHPEAPAVPSLPPTQLPEPEPFFEPEPEQAPALVSVRPAAEPAATLTAPSPPAASATAAAPPVSALATPVPTERRWVAPQERVTPATPDVTALFTPPARPSTERRSAAARRCPVVIVFAGKGGVGKCLTGDAQVVDPTSGVPVRLDQYVARESLHEVLSFDGQAVTVQKVTDKVDSGRQRVLRVSLSSGRSITCTLHHPLLMPDGWRRADSIAIGETVAVLGSVPAPLAPVPMNADELDLLAVLLAEGGTSTRATLFSSGDPSIVDIARSAADGLGLTVTRVPGSRFDYRLSGGPQLETQPGECRCGCGTSVGTRLSRDWSRGAKRGDPYSFLPGHGGRQDNVLRSLRRRHGLERVLAKDKHLPEAVFRLPDAQLARFLAVFFMCDGYVSRAGVPEVTLASKDLIYDLQHVLLRFGIQTSVRYCPKKYGGKVFDSWKLRVYSQFAKRFQETIGLWGEKGARIEARHSVSNPNVGSPSWTEELLARLRTHPPAYTHNGHADRWVDKLWEAAGWHKPERVNTRARAKGSGQGFRLFLTGVSSTKITGGYLSPTALRAFLDVFPQARDEFGWLIDGGIWWDRVESIEEVGVQHVWDLSVAATANFVANDVVVHNTTTTMALAQRAVAQGGLGRTVAEDLSRGQGDLRKYLRVANAALPSIFDAAISGEPKRAVITPTRLNAERDPALPPLNFGVVLAPTDDQADPDVVTAESYRSVIELTRSTCDLVVIDTQIIEAKDTSGLIDALVVPLLLDGAWGLALSDSSEPGVTNILARLNGFRSRGVGPSRMMFALNRMSLGSGLDQERLMRLTEQFGTWVGAVPDDSAIAASFAAGYVPGDAGAPAPILTAMLDAVLARVTGLDAFNTASPSGPGKRRGGAQRSGGLFGRRRRL